MAGTAVHWNRHGQKRKSVPISKAYEISTSISDPSKPSSKNGKAGCFNADPDGMLRRLSQAQMPTKLEQHKYIVTHTHTPFSSTIQLPLSRLFPSSL